MTEKETLMSIKKSIFPAFPVQKSKLTDFEKGHYEGLLAVLGYINDMLEQIEGGSRWIKNKDWLNS